MKKFDSYFYSASFCILLDIVLGVMVYKYGVILGASWWSMLLSYIFYSVGCVGVYVFLMTICDWIKEYKKNNSELYYGPKKQ